MEQVSDIFRDWGHLAYPVIFLWTFFEGETVVIFGGYAAFYDVLDERLLFACAWLGSFLGDQAWYYVGRRYGPRLIKRFPKWQPGVFHVSELMARYGVWFILSFRFIYGVRNVSSITIGMIHYPRLKFAAINCIAACVWAAAFVGFGYGFAFLSDVVTASLPESLLGDAVKIIGFSALVLFVAVGAMLVRRQIRRQKEERKNAVSDAEGPDHP